MIQNLKITIVYIALFYLALSTVWAQGKKSSIRFRENKGQFENSVRYKLSINEGDIYLENNKVTYNLFSRDLISDIHHSKKPKNTPVKGHAYNVTFENANATSLFYGEEKSSDYSNYFIGKDQSKWAKNVYDYQTIFYKDIYDGIDLKFYGSQIEDCHLKCKSIENFWYRISFLK